MKSIKLEHEIRNEKIKNALIKTAQFWAWATMTAVAAYAILGFFGLQ